MLVLSRYRFPPCLGITCTWLTYSIDISSQVLLILLWIGILESKGWEESEVKIAFTEECRRCSPYASSSSPPLACGRLAWQKQGSVQLMPAFLQVLRIHCLPLCLSRHVFFFKKKKRRRKTIKNKQTKKHIWGYWVNTFSPTVRLKQTSTLPPQS